MANNITRWRKEDPPNLLLAIDPGARFKSAKRQERVPYAGAALFQWGELVWAKLVKCPTVIDNVQVPPFARPYQLVKKVCKEANIARFSGEAGRKGNPGETVNILSVERPIIYTRGSARPQDIIDLREIYGAFMGGIEAEFYAGPTPEEWKGSIDGVTLNERAVTVLNSSEQMVLMKAQREGEGGLSDHVIDGVGLGLFTLARAGKAMVIG